MKALINTNNIVADVVNNNDIYPVHPDLKWVDCTVNCETGWLWDGEILSPPLEPILSSNDFKFLYVDALKTLLYSKAIEKEYDSEQSIVSYKDSTNTTWKQESIDFIAWRDSVWVYAYTVLAQVENEEIEPPNIEDFINNAPTLEWS